MSRSLTIEAPSWEAPSRTKTRTWSFDVRVITPMFGGSARTREVNSTMPVRAAGVRGSLRFWWRAGVVQTTSHDLFKAEEEIWGSAAVPGKLSIAVTTLSMGVPIAHEVVTPKANPKTGPGVGYFLFPFQNNKKEGIPSASGQEDVVFRLTITGPESQRADVERTVRAWLLFGGVGARTRRGCGALDASDWRPPPGASGLDMWLGLQAQAPTNNQTPHLHGARIAIGPRYQSAKEAWKELAGFWAAFRKGHVGPGEYQPMKGGHWADYQALTDWQRTRTGSIALEKPALGLPIIYQALHGAPFHGTVQPRGTTRMASPVILRPVAFAENDFRPLMLVFRAPAPNELRIDERPVTWTSNPKDPVLTKLGVDNPLDAVIRAAEIRWGGDATTFTLGGCP